jgi:metallo-beta-lactamase class B
MLRLTSLLVALSAGSLPASCRHSPPALQGAQPSETASLAPDVTVSRLRPDIWLHTSKHPLGISSNGLLLVRPDGLMLIDTACTTAQTEALMGWAERTFGRRWLGAVATHWHDDRIGGAAAVRRRGVTLDVLDLTAQTMVARNLGPASVLVRAGEGSRRDDRGFEVFYPGAGHTRDNLVVWIPEAKLLFGGCLIKEERARHIGNVTDADLQGWPGAIKNLQRRYPGVDLVVPGHGRPGGPQALGNTLALLAALAWPELQSVLEPIAAREDGLVGVAIVHVGSGRTASLNGGRRFHAASVYKLPIGLALLDAAERGQVDLEEAVLITERDELPGVSRLWKGVDVQVTCGRLLEIMIGDSNNAATDVILRRLGGPRAVTAYLERVGFGTIRVDRTLRERFADTRAPASAPDERDTTTPNAMARLLADLAKGKLLTGPSRQRLLGIMTASRVFPDRLPGLLPAGTPVAHKSGTWTGRAVNDVGIVTLPSGDHLAIAVLIAGSKRPLAHQERTIAEIARAAYGAATAVR